MTRIALRVGAPLIAAAALLAGTLVLAHPSARFAPPLMACNSPEPPPIVDPKPIVNPMPVQQIDTPIVDVEAPRPTPSDDVYARLALCLKDHKLGPDVRVTVEQVRHWVEVEKDPAWRANEAWWLPLSGEGEEHYPSGLYISVPDTGTACGGAIMN
jgi:hypothetical protein